MNDCRQSNHCVSGTRINIQDFLQIVRYLLAIPAVALIRRAAVHLRDNAIPSAEWMQNSSSSSGELIPELSEDFSDGNPTKADVGFDPAPAKVVDTADGTHLL